MGKKVMYIRILSCLIFTMNTACLLINSTFSSEVALELLSMSASLGVFFIAGELLSPSKKKSRTCSVCGAVSEGEFCPTCGSRLVHRHYDRIDSCLYDIDFLTEDTDELSEDKAYEDTEEDIARVRQAFIHEEKIDDEF